MSKGHKHILIPEPMRIQTTDDLGNIVVDETWTFGQVVKRIFLKDGRFGKDDENLGKRIHLGEQLQALGPPGSEWKVRDSDHRVLLEAATKPLKGFQPEVGECIYPAICALREATRESRKKDEPEPETKVAGAPRDLPAEG